MGGLQGLGAGRFVHGAHVAGLQVQAQAMWRIHPVLAESIGAVAHIEGSGLATLFGQLVQARHDMALHVVGVLVDGIQPHHFAGQHVAAIGEARDQAKGLQRDQQAHDGALDQPGAGGELGQAQGRIADTKGGEHGQDAVGGGDASNLRAWTRGVQPGCLLSGREAALSLSLRRGCIRA